MPVVRIIPRRHVHQPSLGAEIVATITHQAKLQADDRPFQSAREIVGDLVAEFVVVTQPCPALPALERMAANANYHRRQHRPRPFPLNVAHIQRGSHPRRLSPPRCSGRWRTAPPFRHRPPNRSAGEGEDVARRRDLLSRPPAVPAAIHRQYIRSAGRLHKATATRHVRHVAASKARLRRDISRNIGPASTSPTPADGVRLREWHLEGSPCGLPNRGVEGVHLPLHAGDLEARPGARPSSSVRQCRRHLQMSAESDGAVFSAGAAHHTGLPSDVAGSDSRAHSAHAVRRPHLDQQCNLATNMLECVLPVCPHKQRSGRVAHSPEHQGSCMLVALLHDESSLIPVQVRLVSDGKLKRHQKKVFVGLQKKILCLWEEYENGDHSAHYLLRACARLYGPRV